MSAAPIMSLKSPEAFRTISEVAALLDMPQHVLRFWESRFAHIKPIKRAGGRRFYRPEDVNLLRGIRALLYFDGYTIKGVQKILREKGARFVAECGRNDAMKHGIARAPDSAPRPEGESFDALATLARVRAAAAETLALDEERRVQLETMLTELLALKSHLAATRARVTA